MDALGTLIEQGRAATEDLWQAPDDPAVRARAGGAFAALVALVHDLGTAEMQAICDRFCPKANAAPTPQAIEFMQDGLERLHTLWLGAR